jgi:molybdate transport system substrate-binding protein
LHAEHKPTHRSGGFHNAWVLSIASVVVICVLVVLLWALGQRRPMEVGQQRELVVYCAAGLIKPMEQIGEAYEKEYGVRVDSRPNGSKAWLGELRKHPTNVDLFLAADDETMNQARSEGLVAETIPVTVQHPVIALRKGFPKDRLHSLRDLLDKDIRVALPNPETTSIGSVVRAAHPKEWESLANQLSPLDVKVSYAGTVVEVANLVKVGTSVDAGIVWDANAVQAGLEYVVPEELETLQDHVVLGVVKWCSRPAALHFARYVTARDRGEETLQDNHYQPVPDADIWVSEPRIKLMVGAMLRPALERTLDEFQEREGVGIDLVANGCGILASQIKAGERPAAYFSCDIEFMKKVQQWFESPVVISENDLVMLVRKDRAGDIKSVEDLSKPDLRVGLADDQAALGVVTREFLQHREVYEPLVNSGNWKLSSATGDYLVSQILAGSVDAVIVYRSNARVNPKIVLQLEMVEIADEKELALSLGRATQPFAIARYEDKEGHERFGHKYLLERLLDAIRSEPSRKRFEELGFHWKATP